MFAQLRAYLNVILLAGWLVSTFGAATVTWWKTRTAWKAEVTRVDKEWGVKHAKLIKDVGDAALREQERQATINRETSAALDVALQTLQTETQRRDALIKELQDEAAKDPDTVAVGLSAGSVMRIQRATPGRSNPEPSRATRWSNRPLRPAVTTPPR